ncbi:MAG TPA: hypothetical protein PL181_07135 [bacterium]|nr:hypothetical protein [bacterium]
MAQELVYILSRMFFRQVVAGAAEKSRSRSFSVSGGEENEYIPGRVPARNIRTRPAQAG